MADSLNGTLRKRGYTTRPSKGMYKKQILRRGKVLFTGDAAEVWDWLRRQADKKDQ